MLIPTDTSVETTDPSVDPRSDAPLELDFERELDSALDDMEAGGFIELSLEDVELWAEKAG
jgi:hypothetical protein